MENAIWLGEGPPTDRQGGLRRLRIQRKKGATGHARLRPSGTRLIQRLIVVSVVVLIVVLIAAMIVVVIIPVAIRVPPVAIFVPPPVRMRPAILARLMQLLARVYRLPAVPSVVFGSFMQPVVGFRDPPLA
jgi:hypothetical protein